MHTIEPRLFQLLTDISTILAQHSRQAFIVGGFVRDWILDRKTGDIDIAVAGSAIPMAKQIAQTIGGKYVLLDEGSEVARVITSREEQQRHIDFNGFSSGIEGDLARRDFTINAIAVELQNFISGSPDIIDPFNGRNDLKKGVIRATSRQVFKGDAARLVRAVRLAAELEFKIESKTARLMKQNSRLIKSVPGERIREELIKLLALPGFCRQLYYLDKLNLLSEIIPEVDAMKGVEQPKEHNWDVFNHSIETVAAVEFLLHKSHWDYGSKDLLAVIPWSEEIRRHFNTEVSSGSKREHMLKLAGLLHDIAKPMTKTIEKSGRMRFIGHTKQGATMAGTILNRLRFSHREIKLVENMVYYHLRPVQMANVGLPTKRAVYRYFRDAGDAGIDTLFLALADYLATSGPKLNVSDWERHNQLIGYIMAEQRRQNTELLPVKIINGHDLMSAFGLTPGPMVGKLLDLVHEAQAIGRVNTREQAIAVIHRELQKRYGGGHHNGQFEADCEHTTFDFESNIIRNH